MKQSASQNGSRFYFVPSMASLAALATRNFTTRLALIWIVSPVAGGLAHVVVVQQTADAADAADTADILLREPKTEQAEEFESLSAVSAVSAASAASALSAQ